MRVNFRVFFLFISFIFVLQATPNNSLKFRWRMKIWPTKQACKSYYTVTSSALKTYNFQLGFTLKLYFLGKTINQFLFLCEQAKMVIVFLQ